MPNEVMRELWSKYGGPAWIGRHELFESVYAPFNDAAIAALGELDGRSVLDVGCGPGSLSRAVLEHGGVAVGVDIADSMIAGARELVPGARFEVADAQVEPLARFAPSPAGFDRVTSRFGVMFFEDPVAAFANIRAAVRPAGRLGFVCWRGLEENPTFTLGTHILAERIPDPPGEAPASAPGPASFADADAVRDVLARSGWEAIEVEPFEAMCDYGGDGSDGVERRLDMILAGQTGRLAEQRLRPTLDEVRWRALLDEVRAEIREARVDGVVRFPGRTWVVTATNP